MERSNKDAKKLKLKLIYIFENSLILDYDTACVCQKMEMTWQ
jgi:hypothetical protein